jgi:hypothetical protein
MQVMGVTNEIEEEQISCIEAQRGIYRVHERQEGEGNPRLGDDYFTLNTPLKCNVNAMTLHLKSGTKYMS